MWLIFANERFHTASQNEQTCPLIRGSAAQGGPLPPHPYPTFATGTDSAPGKVLPVGSSLPREREGKREGYAGSVPAPKLATAGNK